MSAIYLLLFSNSSRGDISLEFFNNLKLQVSKYQDSGLLCICGDFNARIGSLVDIDIEAVADSVPKRVILDATSPNSHGKELIEFVRDVWLSSMVDDPVTMTLLHSLAQMVPQLLTTVSSPLNNGTLLGHSQFYHLLNFLTDSTSQLIVTSQTTPSSYGLLSLILRPPLTGL